MDVHAPSAGYLAELQQAVAFSRELGLSTRRGFVAGPPMLNEEFRDILREWSRINICLRPDHEIAGRCLRISVELTEFLAGAGVPVMFTLGWMVYGGETVFRFGRSDVCTWLEHGLPNRDRLDMHAWVTLGSGEIVDASWLSTIAVVRGRHDLRGAVIALPPEPADGHRYHPIVVDTVIVERLHLVGLVQDPVQLLQFAGI